MIGKYCKTLYFSCILIWRFWSVEISLHFNLAFSQGVLCKVKFHVTLAISTELCITVCTSRPIQCMFVYRKCLHPVLIFCADEI